MFYVGIVWVRFVFNWVWMVGGMIRLLFFLLCSRVFRLGLFRLLICIGLVCYVFEFVLVLIYIIVLMIC